MKLSYGVSSLYIPMFQPSTTVDGVNLTAYRLTVYNWGGGGTLIIDGNSTLTKSSDLTAQDYGHGSAPRGDIENNGAMRLIDSTLEVGALKGHGTVSALRSTIKANSAVTSETIQIHSSYLDIGGALTGADPGMKFLAPIKGFDASSTINLEDTHATLEVYYRASGALFLFDGSQMVANMHVSGSPHVYASNNTLAIGGGHPSALLTATNTGHAIPVWNVG